MKLKTALLSALAVITLTLAGAQAMAQTSMDDPLDDRSAKRLDRMEKVVRELRAIVFQGKETGKPVVVQSAETEPQIQALTDRVTDLEQTLTRITGQNETLTHDLQTSRQAFAQSQADNKALQTRLDALEKRTSDLEAQYRGPPAPPAPDPAAAAPVASADPEGDAFAAARKLLVDGNTAGAESAFGAYIEQYGDGPHGAEARYWYGETLFARKAWSDAGAAYLGSLRGWPTTPWAPTATLNLARSLQALGNSPQACRALDELAKHYPKAAPPVPARAATTRAQAACPAPAR
ncbi:MAG: tol-pal system protein YbgF [Caulobacter sp.]|nr:tol-pal system protein YbgF [Caulobacter sp.]